MSDNVQSNALTKKAAHAWMKLSHLLLLLTLEEDIGRFGSTDAGTGVLMRRTLSQVFRSTSSKKEGLFVP